MIISAFFSSPPFQTPCQKIVIDNKSIVPKNGNVTNAKQHASTPTSDDTSSSIPSTCYSSKSQSPQQPFAKRSSHLEFLVQEIANLEAAVEMTERYTPKVSEHFRQELRRLKKELEDLYND